MVCKEIEARYYANVADRNSRQSIGHEGFPECCLPNLHENSSKKSLAKSLVVNDVTSFTSDRPASTFPWANFGNYEVEKCVFGRSKMEQYRNALNKVVMDRKTMAEEEIPSQNKEPGRSSSIPKVISNDKSTNQNAYSTLHHRVRQ